MTYCIEKSYKFIKPKDLRKIFIGASDSTFTKWVEYGLFNKYKTLSSVFYKDIEIIQLLKMCKEGTATTHKVNLNEDKFIRAKHVKNFITISQNALSTLVANGLLNRYKIGGGVYYLQSDVVKLPKMCRRII